MLRIVICDDEPVVLSLLEKGVRAYITTKRGNHGLGMKRVQAVVNKYEGFLRLANEPGIFAAEVTLPLEAQQA